MRETLLKGVFRHEEDARRIAIEKAVADEYPGRGVEVCGPIYQKTPETSEVVTVAVTIRELPAFPGFFYVAATGPRGEVNLSDTSEGYDEFPFFTKEKAVANAIARCGDKLDMTAMAYDMTVCSGGQDIDGTGEFWLDFPTVGDDEKSDPGYVGSW
jgi:hypothetical protein